MPDSSRPSGSWTRVKELFHEALEQPADQRRGWLAGAAGSDVDLFHEVESLLAAHDGDGSFLAEPAAASIADAQVFAPGTRLGAYEILHELGRGGAGVVYLARDHRLGRQVALKLVADGAQPELRDRLRREARAAATIAHPAVATVHALEEFDDQLFIVSEYVRGRTLRAVLADGPLPFERVKVIAREIAGALQAAHEAGVVHRDLKPENILLAEQGSVKVVDFGIATSADDITRLTRHGALLGTPAYMAPEQLLGSEVDGRADIYAFGIVVIEMLTGRHPGLPTPAAIGTSTPEEDELLTLARKCTELDRAARYPSAALLVDALGHLDRNTGTSRRRSHWWWEFHQAAVATVYWLTLFPAWHARSAIGGALGRVLFIVILAAVVVSACLRLHLWFTSRFYPTQLEWSRKRSARWITAGDVLFSGSLVASALLVRPDASSVDTLLLSLGVGAAVAFLAIEPTTTRAAFGHPD